MTGGNKAGAGGGNRTPGGEATGLASLQVAGHTVLGGNVASTGDQSYGGAVVLAADATLTATGAAAVIGVAGAIDRDSSSTARALVINASGAPGQAVLGGAVGSTAPLNTLAPGPYTPPTPPTTLPL